MHVRYRTRQKALNNTISEMGGGLLTVNILPFAMMLITALRFRSINMVARRFDKKLRSDLSTTAHSHLARHSRNHKINKTITKNESDQPRLASRWKSEFPSGQEENQEVEAHRVYEGDSKDVVICTGDDTSDTINIFSFQEHSCVYMLALLQENNMYLTVKDERPVSQDDQNERDDDIPLLGPDSHRSDYKYT